MEIQAKRVMIDDTRNFEVPLAIDPSRLSSSISELESYRISRMLAKGWARSLRFLTFDGELADSESAKQQCARCDLCMGLPSDGHDCISHREPLRALHAKPATNTNACKHVAGVMCGYCEHIPLFPSEDTVTRFKIRRIVPKKESALATGLKDFNPRTHEEYPCCHFVAVSYCCSTAATSTPRTAYTVVEEDGSIRKARASHEVLDRAVAFARENGYRMIWIDQECILQNDEREKEIGIQAMDLVYSCAHVTIALFTTELDQRHFDNLLSFDEDVVATGANIHLKGPKRYRIKERKVINDAALLEAFVSVVHDPWNSRAWVIQEAFAATRNTLILLPRSKSIDTRHLRLVCHAKSVSEVCLDHQVLSLCLNFAHSMARMSPRGDDVKLANEKFRFFLPHAPPRSAREISLGGARARDGCNAAVALSFLKDRKNSVVADRLAIIGNLCDYEIRLDTHSLAESQSSLAICVLGLALMNGDLSLFTPELFRNPWHSGLTYSSFQDLLWGTLLDLPSVSSTSLRTRGIGFGAAAPESYAPCNSGLRFAGFLWKLSKFIDVRLVQERYSESWSALNGERESLVERYFRGSEHFNVNISWDRARIAHEKRRQRAVTQILLELLLLLRDRGEICVADAIWQSTWDSNWSNKKGYKPYQTVGSFPDDVRIENRKCMFKLQEIEFLTYHPEWLIEQIVKTGGFWTAKLVRCASDVDYTEQQCVSATTETKSALFMQDLFDESHEGVHDQSSSTPKAENAAAAWQRDQVPEEIQEYFQENFWENLFLAPATAEMLRQIMEIFKTTLVSYPSSATQTHTLSTAYFNQSIIYGASGELHREDFLRGRIGIFDLGSDETSQNMILTPFQLPLETVTSEPGRHLSMSWLVQQAKQKSEGTKYEAFHMVRMCKGMWPITPMPGGRYQLL